MRWSLPKSGVRAGIAGASCWILAALGCTPLGAWVYSDPALEVARVRLVTDGTGRSPLMVALTVRNPNDYEVTTDRLELALSLDDEAVGQFNRDSTMPFARVATSVVALPLQLAPGATPERLAILGHGTRRFSVTGRARFRTPFGIRVVRFAGAGEMVFGGG
jgi:late embryogenesis abundant protein